MLRVPHFRVRRRQLAGRVRVVWVRLLRQVHDVMQRVVLRFSSCDVIGAGLGLHEAWNDTVFGGLPHALRSNQNLHSERLQANAGWSQMVL